MTNKTLATDEFRTLAENSPDVIVRYDRECRRTYVNPAYEQINELPANSVLGKTPTEFASTKTVAGPMAQALQEMLLTVVDDGREGNIDLTWQDDNGRRRCFELRAVPEFDPQGDVKSVLSVARDLSEQRESNRQLSLLNFAINQVGEALYLMDDSARFLHVNEAACRTLGYSRAELLHMRLFDIDPDFPPERWPEHRQHLLGKRALTKTTRHRRKAGDLLPVEVNFAYFEFEGRPYQLSLAQDISERQRAEEELLRREQEFRALAENSPDTIARYDRECRRVYVNPAFSTITGLAPVDLLGRRPSDYALTVATQRYEEAMQAVFASGKGCELEHTWITRDNKTIISHFRMTPEFDLAGTVSSVLAVGRDITALKESESRLCRTERIARIGYWQWDYQYRESLVSAEVCRLFEQALTWRPSLDDVLDMIIEEDRERVRNVFRDAFAHQEPEISYTYRLRNKLELLHLHSDVQIEYTTDGQPRRLTGTTQDVSELKDYESRLHEITFHDTLTGLPNRALLYERLRQSLSEASGRGCMVGLLIIDLDRFKEINDTHGLDIGDRLLTELARRLISMVRDYDTVARLGGDEFAIVLPEIRKAADLGSISRKILDTLSRPFHIAPQDLFISASIGIAVFPSDGNSSDALLQYADSALYDAKARGRAGFRFYSADLTAKSKDRAALEAALRHAEPKGQLELYYQPKINLADGRLVGVEALLRWQHPELGMVSPDRFIGIAEDTGLIVGIGAWVLTKACLAAQHWNYCGHDLKVAVNLSSRQFHDNDLLSTVRSILALTGCEPQWLELEITESLLLGDDNGVRATLLAFRGMGISIAIDDFGTGYSALGYLKRFPIDVLKIDRSFTRDVMLERDSTELVKAIITMAHSLRLELVAEGIETEAQELFLRAHGCNLGQGYRYGKPMPKETFEARLLNDKQSLLDSWIDPPASELPKQEHS